MQSATREEYWSEALVFSNTMILSIVEAFWAGDLEVEQAETSPCATKESQKSTCILENG